MIWEDRHAFALRAEDLAKETHQRQLMAKEDHLSLYHNVAMVRCPSLSHHFPSRTICHPVQVFLPPFLFRIIIFLRFISSGLPVSSLLVSSLSRLVLYGVLFHPPSPSISVSLWLSLSLCLSLSRPPFSLPLITCSIVFTSFARSV